MTGKRLMLNNGQLWRSIAAAILLSTLSFFAIGHAKADSIFGWGNFQSDDSSSSGFDFGIDAPVLAADHYGHETLRVSREVFAHSMAVVKQELAEDGVDAEHLEAAAAGLVGNAYAESSLIPTLIHDRGTGYGVYGARLGRMHRMFSWLRTNGYERSSRDGQLRYMAIEAMKDPRFVEARAALLNAHSARAAAVLISERFEFPARWDTRNWLRVRGAELAMSADGGSFAGVSYVEGRHYHGHHHHRWHYLSWHGHHHHLAGA